MKKKILVFLSVISICLFGLFNSFPVLAESDSYIYRPLNFYTGWEVVSIGNYTFTASTEFSVFWIDKTLPLNEAIELYSKQGLSLEKGAPHGNAQRYQFEWIDEEEYKVRLMISINKNHYTTYCIENELNCSGNNPNPATLPLYMSIYFSGYYLSVYASSDLIKNFLLAEPNLENGFEHIVGNERYYMYLDARVYLPDGTTTGLAAMPDVISDRPDLFDGYDFVAISFNLSPRARFWSPSIYPAEPILGLSYIVYDLIVGSTTLYDYMGRVAYHINSIIYIDTPQFILPEMEALDYQVKSAYEEGKSEGYKQGREEGKRAGRREAQEEMQKIIDDLIEQYEKEVERAYKEGKLAGANEQFDIFAYLQALFGEQGLGRLLRLELLPGVSLGAVIMIPLAFWLVSFIMRWFR